MLICDFIFEVADGGREATVEGHVGVADETETQLETESFGERLLLKDAAADHLAGDSGEHFVFARGENVHAGDLRFLVKLLGTEFNGLARALVLGFLKRRFEKHLLQQIGMVKILRVAFEKSGRGQCRLLDVQILGLLKLEQRADVIGLRRVNDDDPFALFELADEVVTVERGNQGHGHGDKKPEPRQPVALREKLGGVERPAGGDGGFCAGGSFVESGSFHSGSVVMAFGFGDEFADGFVAGDVVTGTATGGARRQTRTGDDDCAGAADTGGG